MAKRRVKKKGGGEPPMCNTLLLCDDVLASVGKDKHILHGIIGRIIVPSFPAVVGGYVAYVRVSNVYGSQKMNLNFQEAATNDILFQIKAEFSEKAEPLGVYNLVIPIRAFVVERPGRYLFVAESANGIPMASTPIQIVDVREIDTEPEA